ncbi:MAG: hypothetical protein OEY17_05050 [Nitrosopumilus sp.]|nr:hypothetical protein [Nitrosopumilus sp.]
MTKFLYVSLTTAFLLMSVLTTNAFAETDFKKIQGEDLQNNPMALDILKKIEIARKQFEQTKENEQKRTEQQKLIDEQRTLAKTSLNEELKRMEKRYDQFTPTNAYARFVSSTNSTNPEIFWDQFNYLGAKLTIAKDARDSILQQGGTYADAMQQYVHYAKMSKIEMLNVIKDLNIKHNLAQKEIQSYFDINGHLPRYENDLEAPCYGCTEKISKIQVSSEQSIPVQIKSFEKPITQINNLQDSLSELQKAFVESKDMVAQKKMVFEMNNLVKQIKELE